MNTCPACSASVSENTSRCPSCGAVLTGTQATIRQPPKEKSKSPASSRSTSTSTRGEGKFLAGTVLNERYRITGLLGRGGMGEVYKAEDLKLNQTVALKFLPEHFAEDAAAHERFIGEVRTARQVSHPNVCRVFDIGEVDGAQFLSMEFIDGDDLSSLLRRIGRLPPDKALEIGRELCAGLHAVHQAGILHRDFKPANVMIDGRGKARITDFGVAGVESELKEGAIAGTPAYMSPEQIAGKELTAKSDIYSLGLVLYEVFTGKRVFEGDTINELIRKHQATTPTNPSEHVKDIDPLVEQVILRCLSKDPQKRPTSAMQVALALPGGDPLEAALAMGETPSPEMVAAAGEKTGLRPMIAAACLLAVFVGLVGLAFLGRRVSLLERVPFENPPEILAAKARETIAQLGYPDRPFDKAHGLSFDADFLGHTARDAAADRWRKLENVRGGALYFWYRESPIYLQLLTPPTGKQEWDITYSDPPPYIPGMRGVKFDTLGRLREFYNRMPLVEEPQSSEAGTTDWNQLFTLAGVDPSRFTPDQPRWIPESAYDTRAAWAGTAADMPDIPLRVEAASYRGKVVFFKLIAPWTKPPRLVDADNTPLIFFLLPLVLFCGAILLAWRNYRQGKSDRQGAIRLIFFLFICEMLTWLLSARHIPTTSELTLLAQALRRILYWSAVIWTFYIALEPYVRRRWPTSLITWSRVVSGKIRDPLVGRDLLIGILLGLSYSLLLTLPRLVDGQPLTDVELDQLAGIRFVVGSLLNSANGAVIFAFTFTFLLTLLRALLRRDWRAGIVALVIVALPHLLSGSPPVAVAGLILGALLVLAFIRFGLLTVATSLSIYFWLNGLAFTTNLSAWYASIQLLVMFMVTALATLSFYTSLGGQKVFKRNLLEE